MKLRVNGEIEDIGNSNLSQAIEDMGLDPSRVAVELNGKIVPRADFKSTVLKDGDSLEIVHFVGGG